MNRSVLEFWNNRAKLKNKAGSNDVILKSLEIEAIVHYMQDGLEVAEFGCGNGITALEIAQRFDVKIDAFDFSPEMIKEAIRYATTLDPDNRINFAVADITNLPKLFKYYDVIFTERVIINLSGWSVQLKAIRALATYLKPGGKLLLVESSATGLEEINKLRAAVDLPAIVKPWHNVYLNDSDVAAEDVPNCRLVDVIPFSSTYYFLSRVVNAWLAKEAGHEPSYDAKVNHLAKRLPPIGDFAQSKLWVWEHDL